MCVCVCVCVLLCSFGRVGDVDSGGLVVGRYANIYKLFIHVSPAIL